MQLIKKVIYALNLNALKLSMIVILFLMFITVGDVFGRFFFNRPISGTFELTRIALVTIVFISLGYSQIQKVNISITLFVSRLPLFAQNVIDLFNSLLSLTLFSLISWQMFRYAERLSAAGQYTTVLRLPMHPWVLIAAAGALLLCMALLWDMLLAVRKLFKGDVIDES
jgi:TRAP-type transport system small permease protein